MEAAEEGMVEANILMTTLEATGDMAVKMDMTTGIGMVKGEGGDITTTTGKAAAICWIS